MQKIKKTAEYTLFQKNSGHYAVKGKNGKWINAEEKQGILVAEQLITLPRPKAVSVEPEAESSEADSATA